MKPSGSARKIEELVEWRPPPTATEGTTPHFTPAEVRVVRLLVKGRGNEEIATSLLVSRRTVEQHVTRILTKLGVASRAEAVAACYRAALEPAAQERARAWVKELTDATHRAAPLVRLAALLGFVEELASYPEIPAEARRSAGQRVDEGMDSLRVFAELLMRLSTPPWPPAPGDEDWMKDLADGPS